MVETILAEWPRFATLPNVAFLARAAATTLALSAVGVVLGSLLGLAVAVAGRTRAAWLLPLRLVARLYAELFRRVPFLVTLMLTFYLVQASGADLPLGVVAGITVTLIAGAYLAEIVRAGLNAVHSNQWEAAATMNFTLLQTIRLVVLPQAWPLILPPAFGFFVMFIKDTALASQIGVIELTYAARVLNNKGFSAALSFGCVLLLYFALSYPLARLGARLESRLAGPRHPRP
jgi:polar amino acid transport system permease protein